MLHWQLSEGKAATVTPARLLALHGPTNRVLYTNPLIIVTLCLKFNIL